MSIKAFFQKVWATPPVHALLVAVGSSIAGAFTPYVLALYNYAVQYLSNPTAAITFQFPTLNVIVKMTIFAAFTGIVGYLTKNGWKGGSGVVNQQNK